MKEILKPYHAYFNMFIPYIIKYEDNDYEVLSIRNSHKLLSSYDSNLIDIFKQLSNIPDLATFLTLERGIYEEGYFNYSFCSLYEHYEFKKTNGIYRLCFNRELVLPGIYRFYLKNLEFMKN